MDKDKTEPQKLISEDRRAHERFNTKVQVRYRAYGAADFKTAKAGNLSEGGTSILAQGPIPEGSICELELFLDGQKEPIYATAKVLWQKVDAANQSNGYSMGFRWIGMPPDHRGRLKSFIAHISSDKPQQAGSWKLPYKEFVYYKQVSLKHSNLEGNTYFDNYLTWQGEARESLLLSHPDISNFLRKRRAVKMITHSAYHKFLRDSYFGDVVAVRVTSTKVRHCSFILIFRFLNLNSGVLLGEGWQKICIADKKNRLTTIPQHILDLIEPIQEETAEDFLKRK